MGEAGVPQSVVLSTGEGRVRLQYEEVDLISHLEGQAQEQISVSGIS